MRRGQSFRGSLETAFSSLFFPSAVLPTTPLANPSFPFYFQRYAGSGRGGGGPADAFQPSQSPVLLSPFASSRAALLQSHSTLYSPQYSSMLANTALFSLAALASFQAAQAAPVPRFVHTPSPVRHMRREVPRAFFLPR